jgi:hypothetical protein
MYTLVSHIGPYPGTEKVDDSGDEDMAVVDGARRSHRTPLAVTTGLYFGKNNSFDLNSLESGGSDMSHTSGDDADDSSLEDIPSTKQSSISPPLDTPPMHRSQQ